MNINAITNINMKDKKKYITFALPLIKQLYLEPTIVKQEILLFAMNAKALQYNVKVKDVVDEVIYDVATGCNRMSPYIYDTLQEYQPLNRWESLQIFSDGQKMDSSLAEEEADYIRGKLTKRDEYDDEKDDQFINDAYLFARRRRAAADMELTMPEWWAWDAIEPFASLYEGQVPVSISFDRLEGWNIGTEYDRVKLGVYLAVRSFAKDNVGMTTLQAIKWRSLGCRNEQEYQQALNDKQLQAIAYKWHTRWNFEKIIADLSDVPLIRTLGRLRHTFVSASILDEDAFIEAVADKIQNINAKARKKRVSATKKQMNTKLNEVLNKLTE